MKKYQNNVVDSAGNPVSGATVQVNNYPHTGAATIYSANDSTLNDLVFAAFAKETGIQVEPVAAGSGVLVRRLQSEKARPQGDITIEAREVAGAGDIQIKTLPCRVESMVKMHDVAVLKQAFTAGSQAGASGTPEPADSVTQVVAPTGSGLPANAQAPKTSSEG